MQRCAVMQLHLPSHSKLIQVKVPAFPFDGPGDSHKCGCGHSI
jgi:hypothetical protein